MRRSPTMAARWPTRRRLRLKMASACSAGRLRPTQINPNGVIMRVFVSTTVAAATFLAASHLLGQAGDAIGTAERIAKGKAKAKSAPTPRTAQEKIDFSGIWSPDRTFIYDINETLKKGEELPIQPWALKLTKERMSKDDPEAQCLPTGVPRQA